jgi:hypothetical protein
MGSVGDALREAQRVEESRLSPAERVRRALELGDSDVETFARARGSSAVVARRELRRARRVGRVPSASADALLE